MSPSNQIPRQPSLFSKVFVSHTQLFLVFLRRDKDAQHSSLHLSQLQFEPNLPLNSPRAALQKKSKCCHCTGLRLEFKQPPKASLIPSQTTHQHHHPSHQPSTLLCSKPRKKGTKPPEKWNDFLMLIVALLAKHPVLKVLSPAG